MADLNEIKDINADLPLTNFPDEIDELESFSDADDEINSAIITYKNLMKQGETAKAEELYEKYSLKKYIVSAYFLNKIQHMIIACERSISSVKKYFSFSTDAPTGTTSQPNGYLWGKVLQAGDYFKKVILKLKENGSYVDIFPRTTADNVLMSEDKTETVKDKLEELSENLNDANETLNKKMNKDEPRGTGSLGMNLGDALIGGEGFNSVSLGTCNTSVGKNSMAFGSECQVLANNAIAEGFGLNANVPNQHVSGKYNEAGNYAQIIGNGTSKTDRKNIYTVDWDGNVKAKSFNASGDIIVGGDVIFGENDSHLTEMSNIVGENKIAIEQLKKENISNGMQINSLSTTLNNLSGKFMITGIDFYISSEDDVVGGDSVTFEQTVNYTSGEKWLFIPRGMSTSAGGLDVGSLSDHGSGSGTISFSLINSSDRNHNIRIGWYWIRYIQI